MGIFMNTHFHYVLMRRTKPAPAALFQPGQASASFYRDDDAI